LPHLEFGLRPKSQEIIAHLTRSKKRIPMTFSTDLDSRIDKERMTIDRSDVAYRT